MIAEIVPIRIIYRTYLRLLPKHTGAVRDTMHRPVLEQRIAFP